MVDHGSQRSEAITLLRSQACIECLFCAFLAGVRLESSRISHSQPKNRHHGHHSITQPHPTTATSPHPFDSRFSILRLLRFRFIYDCGFGNHGSFVVDKNSSPFVPLKSGPVFGFGPRGGEGTSFRWLLKEHKDSCG